MLERQVEIQDNELTVTQRQLLDDLKREGPLKEILKMKPVRDGKRIITFRSNMIFETLLDSKELFRAVIYAECVRKRVFDTVVTNTGFTRFGIDYEAQIIGIKDNYLYPIVIPDSTDYRKLRLGAIDMMEDLPGKVIYFINSKNEVPQKEGSRFYCLTPDDVDYYQNGAYVPGISDAIRGLIKKKKSI